MFETLFVASVFLPRLSVEMGFTIKLLFFLALVHLIRHRTVAVKITFLEISWFALIVYGGLTSIVNATNVGASMRLLAGAILVFFVYLNLKDMLLKNIDRVPRIIELAGYIFVASSLGLYLAGVAWTGGIFRPHEGEVVIGFLVERGLPRLTGPVQDPNFAGAYAMFFMFFALFRNRINLLLFMLASVVLLLTLSRAGILTALVCTLIIFVHLIFAARGIAKRLAVIIFVYAILGGAILANLENLDFVFHQRFRDVERASGRFEIWENAITIFNTNPIFGSGMFNFRTYNLLLFGRDHFAHNTYLEILVDLGIVGFAIYLVFLLFVILNALLIRNPHGAFVKYCLLSSLMMMGSLSMLISEYVFFLAALTLAYREHEKRPDADPRIYRQRTV